MSFFNTVLDDFEVQIRDYAGRFEGITAPSFHENGLIGELDKAFVGLREGSKGQEIETIFRMVEFNYDDHYGILKESDRYKAMFYAGFSMPSFMGSGVNHTHFMCIGCRHNGLLEAYRTDIDLRRLAIFDFSFPSTPDQQEEFDELVFGANLGDARNPFANSKRRILDLSTVKDAFLYPYTRDLENHFRTTGMNWFFQFDNIFSVYEHNHLKKYTTHGDLGMPLMPHLPRILMKQMRQDFHRHFDAFAEKYIDAEVAKETLYLNKTPYYEATANKINQRVRRRQSPFDQSRFHFNGGEDIHVSGFDLYNHIKKCDAIVNNVAPKLNDHLQGLVERGFKNRKERRLGALKVLISTSLYFIPLFFSKPKDATDQLVNPTFWDRVDMGDSPYQIIADKADVPKPVIQRVIRKCNWAVKDDRIGYLAYKLQYLDPQFWPYSNEERHFFEDVVDIAEAYNKAFPKGERHQIDVIKRWIKDNPNIRRDDNDYSWKDLALKVMRPDLIPLVQKNNGRDDIPSDADIEKYLEHKGMNDAVASYKRRVSNIRDMRADVQNKIINPVILMSLEKHGYQVSDQSLLESLSNKVLKEAYDNTLPSEQIAASEYWHSTGVDIKRRFQSAVLNADTGYKQWEGLLGDKPFEIEDGIFIHPLNSNTALEEEADAMTSSDRTSRFCIWSYGSSHFTRNYHMLSIRDKDGHRLCSLTVQDFMGDDGKRQVRFSQNQAIDNTTPCETGKRVADALIEKVNKGEIKPDWQAIDAIRGDYKINQIQNTIGYNYRDQTQAQGVYDVYRPCLPKSIVKASGGQFEELDKALKIDEAIKAFVSDFDWSQGGLIHISSRQSSSTTQQQRPRVA